MEPDFDVDEQPLRRRSRAVIVIASCCMAALLFGAASPLLMAHRNANKPRLTGWTTSDDGRALLVAVGWGDPSGACSDVYVRDVADPSRRAIRVWRSCGTTDAAARFDGPSRIRIESRSDPGSGFSTSYDLDPVRVDALRCTARCVDDPDSAAVARSFDPPTPPQSEEVPA